MTLVQYKSTTTVEIVAVQKAAAASVMSGSGAHQAAHSR